MHGACTLRVFGHTLLFVSENAPRHDIVGRHYVKMYDSIECIEAWCEQQLEVAQQIEEAKWISWGAMLPSDSSTMQCARRQSTVLKETW